MSKPASRIERLIAADPDALAEAPAIYTELRQSAPGVRVGPLLMLTRYDDVKELATDTARFSSDHSRRGSRAESVRARLQTDEQRHAFAEVMELESHFMNRNDGDEHARLRGAAHRAFTPRRIAELRASTDTYAADLVADLLPGEVNDLMEVAQALPLMVICDLLGVPPADRPLIKRLSDGLAGNRHGLDLDALVVAHKAWLEFCEYVESLIDSHRRSPGSGGELVAALLQSEVDDRLAADEVVSTFVMLLEGGNETTMNLISIGLLELLRAPEEWAALVADPTLITNAVEELLRVVSPSGWTSRRATGPTEIASVAVDADQTVVGIRWCANHDPAVFAEPDRVDIRRAEARQHLAFGFGPHYCLGQALARLEAAIALSHLAAAFPQMELAADTFSWAGPASLRRLVSLPVAL